MTLVASEKEKIRQEFLQHKPNSSAKHLFDMKVGMAKGIWQFMLRVESI